MTNPTRTLAHTIATAAHMTVSDLNNATFDARFDPTVTPVLERLSRQTITRAIEALFEVECDDDDDAAFIRDQVEGLKLRFR